MKILGPVNLSCNRSAPLVKSLRRIFVTAARSMAAPVSGTPSKNAFSRHQGHQESRHSTVATSQTIAATSTTDQTKQGKNNL